MQLSSHATFLGFFIALPLVCMIPLVIPFFFFFCVYFLRNPTIGRIVIAEMLRRLWADVEEPNT